MAAQQRIRRREGIAARQRCDGVAVEGDWQRKVVVDVGGGKVVVVLVICERARGAVAEMTNMNRTRNSTGLDTKTSNSTQRCRRRLNDATH